MERHSIGERIRKQREYLGYTREAFAEKLNVTPKFCSDIELGLKGMSIDTLCKISAILMLSTDYILFGESHPAADMFKLCPADKLPYLEEIIKAFLLSLER